MDDTAHNTRKAEDEEKKNEPEGSRKTSMKSNQANAIKKEVVITWGKYIGKTVKEIIAFDTKYAQRVCKQEFVKKFEDIYSGLNENRPL